MAKIKKTKEDLTDEMKLKSALMPARDGFQVTDRVRAGVVHTYTHRDFGITFGPHTPDRVVALCAGHLAELNERERKAHEVLKGLTEEADRIEKRLLELNEIIAETKAATVKVSLVVEHDTSKTVFEFGEFSRAMPFPAFKTALVKMLTDSALNDLHRKVTLYNRSARDEKAALETRRGKVAEDFALQARRAEQDLKAIADRVRASAFNLVA